MLVKMKRTLICCNQRFILGGIETYYIRMFEWAKKNGIRTVLVLQEKSEFDSYWNKILRELDVEIYFFQSGLFYGKIHNSDGNEIVLGKDEKFTIITPTVRLYTIAQWMLKKHGGAGDCLFYVFDPVHIRITKVKWIRFIYQKLFLNKVWDNGLIFMDEETLSYAERCYGVQNVSHEKIVRLGKRFKELDNNLLEKKTEKYEFIILSVCRMQFPFKAYVLGLIDAFTNLEKKYKNIRLYLIGDGENVSQLYEKWKGLPIDLQSKIKLFGRVSYEDLKEYFHEASLYAGMGTTLIDAAEYGIPGIVASAYQTKDYSFGFFHENPCILGGDTEEDGGKKYHMRDLLEQVLNVDRNKYLEIGRQTYSQARNIYDIDAVMKKLFTIHTKPLKHREINILIFIDKLLLLPRIILHSIKGNKMDNLKSEKEIKS